MPIDDGVAGSGPGDSDERSGGAGLLITALVVGGIVWGTLLLMVCQHRITGQRGKQAYAATTSARLVASEREGGSDSAAP
jgi:hypothetical protein